MLVGVSAGALLTAPCPLEKSPAALHTASGTPQRIWIPNVSVHGAASPAAPTSAPTPAATSTPVAWAETVTINGVPIAVSVRGKDASLPPLLVIHGGPGYAMTDLLHARVPELENDFLVVDYDQRGAGLSYRSNIDAKTMTLAQFVEDADAVRQHVLSHYGLPANTKFYVMGHSMGTMIGLDLVAKYPDHYAAYIGVGQVVQVAENEQQSYDFALTEARRTANQPAIDELECVGRPSDAWEYSNPSANSGCDAQADGFEVTNRWMAYFGGDVYGQQSSDSVENAIFAIPAYENSVAAWSAGWDFSQNLFFDPMIPAWDARTMHRTAVVPLFFFMGRHDYDTPAPLAASYAAAIQGTHRLFWFENSAHFPFFEEPTAFYAAMREVRTLAAATGQ
jgi:pimeloyl-ACP methyl ester carboxylesterase